jgi:ABC-type uncharacterized transport system auxiliary subunit
MYRFRQILLVAIAAGIAAGCGTSRPMTYYVLETPAPPEQSSAPQFPVTLLVARVTASELYREDRLVFAASPVELGTYEYQRWAEPPVDMIQDELIASLRATKDFRAVSPVASNMRGDYLLRAHLDALDEVDKPRMAAHFSIQLELYDPKSGSTVWSDSYSHDEPVSGKKVDDVVEALNQDVKNGMTQIASDLTQYFASHQPAK